MTNHSGTGILYLLQTYINTLTGILCVRLSVYRLSVTDVTSLPQRVPWERGYKVYHNAYAGNESPTYCSGRHCHLYRAMATVIGGLGRQDRRH